MTKTIPLTKDKFAIVDDEDYEFLSQWKWHFNKKYACRCIYVYGEGVERVLKNRKQIRIYMHREIMSDPKGMEIDHINGDGLDNRKLNLRICTRKENSRNVTLARDSKKTKYKGVYLRYDRNKKWASYIMGNNGKSVYLGCFYTEYEAAMAYNDGAKRIFGRFAKLNEIID